MSVVWANRNFRLLLSGQFVSWIGTEVSGIALPLLVLALTHSTQQAGFVAAIRGLVYVVWSLPAGALIDRWDRRLMMIGGNLGSGLAMGSIFLALLFKHLTILQLYLAGAIEGSFFVFANLARFASTIQVIDREHRATVSGHINAASYTAESIGPALGGTLYQAAGPLLSFLVDSLSYFVNALSLFFIDVPLKVEKARTDTTLPHEIREGISWLRRQPLLRFVIVISAVNIMLDSGEYLLIIILAKHNHATASVIGLLFAISALGGVFGSLCATSLRARFGFRAMMIATTTTIFVVFSLHLVAHSNYVVGLITFVFTAIEPIFLVTLAGYTATIIPDSLRGRVSSVSRLIELGAHALGFLAMGVLLQQIGTTGSILAFSSVLLVIAVMTRLNRALRNV
jgi:MFS family permease